MSKPMVSVVCTNYNKGEWIVAAIESFLVQKVDFSFEILLIDDKSTDGSEKIIRDYAKRYPDKIRAFYNKKNLGITKTWIKICQEAKGKYIARCDGDDYWIDDQKLQKQVELLEKNKNSKWCNTDCNILSSTGDVIKKSAFKSGYFHMPVSYAEILATKGITAPSTWLVDAKLLRDVNNDISKDAVDDTFNIQLELFNRTNLLHLPQATAVYRINDGSDSRPTDKSIAKERDKKLFDTQLEYLEKYKNIDYEEIIKHLLYQDMESEEMRREAHDRLRIIREQEKHIKNLETIINDKEKAIEERDHQITAILSSKKYKIGKIVSTPVYAAKKIVKRRKL